MDATHWQINGWARYGINIYGLLFSLKKVENSAIFYNTVMLNWNKSVTKGQTLYDPLDA